MILYFGSSTGAACGDAVARPVASNARMRKAHKQGDAKLKDFSVEKIRFIIIRACQDKGCREGNNSLTLTAK
jgi:hypothetical protein